jgi:hypothetical protein
MNTLLTSLFPNQGPSFENLVFDPTYFALTGFTVLVALLAAFAALRNRGSSTDVRGRAMSAGLGLASVGFASVIAGAALLIAMLRSNQIGGVLYLQVEFGMAYFASALIMLGAIMSARVNPRLRNASWLAFALSVCIAAFYLLNPSTYVITSTGGIEHAAQEEVFWVPAFTAMVIGATSLVSQRFRSIEVRGFSTWYALFFIAEFVGILRESTIIPSLGDPLLDLLAAFVPFSAGSVFLLISARNLR